MKTLPLAPPLNAFERSVQTAFQLVQIPDAGYMGERPVVNLVVGQPYFDRTLVRPIWWAGDHWVDATGAPA